MKRIFYFTLGVIVAWLAVHYWPQTAPPARTTETQSTKPTPGVQTPGVEPAVAPTSVSRPAVARPLKPAKSARVPKAAKPYQLIIQKPRPRAPITLEETPEHLKPVVLREMSWKPAYLTNLTAADVEILKRWYQQQGTNLASKSALTMTLGYAGDEEVVEMFKYALFEEYAGKHLTSGGSEKTDEEAVLYLSTVKALGYLASKYDSAYELLKQGTNPEFWIDRVKWTSNRSGDSVGMLTNFSIVCIGGTGRPDSLDFINQLKDQSFLNGVGTHPNRRTFFGALVDAAFFQDLVAERGVEFYQLNLLGSPRKLQRDWSENTGNGREWSAWAKAKREDHYLANKEAIDKAYQEKLDRNAKQTK